MGNIDHRWHGKNVLITGVCNFIGQEFLVRLLKLPVASLVGLGHRRSDLFYLGERYSSEKRLRLLHGDVLDRDFLVRNFTGKDIVIHAPSFGRDSLRKFGATTLADSMVSSTGIIAEAASASDVRRLLVALPQEATFPNETIAEALRDSERLVSSGRVPREDSEFAYFSARLGNMIDRPGATFPQFERQVAAGGPLILANRDATAFITTLSQAVERALSWMFLAGDGDVYVNRIPAFRLQDLAEVMIAALAPLHGQSAQEIAIEFNPRLGSEQLHEELMSAEESRNALQFENRFVLGSPDAPRQPKGAAPSAAAGLSGPYNSERSMLLAFETLWQYLVTHGLLPDREFSFAPADALRMLP
jgi:FlaA1/EpsC-like NDP-sugar epimerase